MSSASGHGPGRPEPAKKSTGSTGPGRSNFVKFSNKLKRCVIMGRGVQINSPHNVSIISGRFHKSKIQFNTLMINSKLANCNF